MPDVGGAIPHITTTFFNEGHRVLYDGIQNSFKSRYNQLSDSPVISVWLVKA
jgi:hypothetical protein